MADVEVRQVTRTVGETDSTGQTTRDETVHEVGAVIDGTFVRFATITQEHLHSAQQRAESGYYGDTGEQPSGEQPAQEQQQTSTTPPDQNVTASEASAATAAP